MPVNVRVRSSPGDDPADQQPPQIDAFAIEAHITTTTTAVKIITLPGHFPLVVKNRSEAAARAFHSAFHDSKVEKPHQQPPERLWETFIRGLSSASSLHAKLTPSKTLTI